MVETKWEYLIAEYDNMTIDETSSHMSYLGGSGWELVSISGDRAYFKRRPLIIGVNPEYVNVAQLEAMVTRLIAEQFGLDQK